MRAMSDVSPISQLARDRLRASGERVTPARVAILTLLLHAGSAMSHQDITDCLQAAGEQFDRVTLYRVLDWLVAQKLAHKLAGEDRIWRFNAVVDEQHIHPHFQCGACGKVSCLDAVQLTLSPLPSGYTLQAVDTTLRGICPGCQPS